MQAEAGISGWFTPRRSRQGQDALPFFHKLREFLEGPVIGLFHVGGKTAGRKFAAAEMIRKTITAHALAGTRLVGAGAFRKILFIFTFHNQAFL